MFDKLDDGKLEILEFLSFKLYGRISYNHGYDDLKPRVTLKKIVNEPEFFIEVVNDVMNDSLGLGKHLLNFCDEKPEAPYDWVVNVNKLIAGKSEEFKGNIEYWVGYIIYNAIEIVNDDYDIDDVIAGLLEKSDKKRVGFYSHAYYPNGVHSNGNFDEDSKDRINAKKFSDMAIIQDVKGNIKFGESLQKFADSLIKGVE